VDRPPAASQDEVRRHNLGSLLELVHVHGDTTRSELAARLGLNRSTVKALTAELSHAGLIRECTPHRAAVASAAPRSLCGPRRTWCTRWPWTSEWST